MCGKCSVNVYDSDHDYFIPLTATRGCDYFCFSDDEFVAWSKYRADQVQNTCFLIYS